MTLFRLDNIHFAYDRAHAVLRGAGFTLAAGERVAVEGANGAGKTTLLHLMVGLALPQAGSVEAFGRVRRKEADFREVRLKAGLLFQDPDDQLFCPTVAEDVAFGPLNMGLGKAEAALRVRETLAALGLDGLEHRVTHQLSGGQRRLVSLAAVLAMRPEVLLLDEPTNALDEPTRGRLLDILAGLPQAMVLVSHDRAVVDRLATRRVRLADGTLKEETYMHGDHNHDQHAGHEHKHQHEHEHTHVHTHPHRHGEAPPHSHAHAHTHGHGHLHQHSHPHGHEQGSGHDHGHDERNHAWKPHEHRHDEAELADHDHEHLGD